MSILEADSGRVATAINGVYNHLLISDVPKNAPYKAPFNAIQLFGLDETGYYKEYKRLLQAVLAIDVINEKWSVTSLIDQIHELLYDLAKIKFQGNGEINFLEIADDWLRRINIEFPIQECYLPVIGLRVIVPVTIGSVTFYPFENIRQELEGRTISNFFEEISSYRDSFVGGKFRAESRKSSELLRIQTEEALNIFRYIGSLVWHREDPRHIYVAGQEKKRISYSLVVRPDGLLDEIGHSEYSPVPYTVDDEFIQYANFYGFDFIQEITKKENRTQIEQNFLTAIQWYGDALQENNPLFAFSKFYTSIETAAKIENETASRVLPKRLSVLIETWNGEKQRYLEKQIKEMISDRNSVFHSGKPDKYTPEYLAWFSRVVAMQTLHHLRLLLVKENIQTKEDIKTWVIKQDMAPYLR